MRIINVGLSNKEESDTYIFRNSAKERKFRVQNHHGNGFVIRYFNVTGEATEEPFDMDKIAQDIDVPIEYSNLIFLNPNQHECSFEVVLFGIGSITVIED